MIHTVKETYELYETSRLEEIKQAAVTADRLGLKEQADLIFQLHLHIKQSLAKSASIFKGIRALIRQQELAVHARPIAPTENDAKSPLGRGGSEADGVGAIKGDALSPDPISEMRFEKSFPGITLNDIPGQ